MSHDENPSSLPVTDADRQGRHDEQMPARQMRGIGRHSGRAATGGSQRSRSGRRSRRRSITLTDDPFEQGILAMGAAILFAVVLHVLTPSSGFLSHIPSGWLGLFPALLCFDRRTIPNKICFAIAYLGAWFFVAGLFNAASQGLIER